MRNRQVGAIPVAVKWGNAMHCVVTRPRQWYLHISYAGGAACITEMRIEPVHAVKHLRPRQPTRAAFGVFTRPSVPRHRAHAGVLLRFGPQSLARCLTLETRGRACGGRVAGLPEAPVGSAGSQHDAAAQALEGDWPQRGTGSQRASSGPKSRGAAAVGHRTLQQRKCRSSEGAAPQLWYALTSRWLPSPWSVAVRSSEAGLAPYTRDLDAATRAQSRLGAALEEQRRTACHDPTVTATSAAA
jgi:hypothetical protein